jgi:small ligand-binding sensory domain FIST
MMDASKSTSFASALSRQADLQLAISEVCRTALEQLEGAPQLAVLFVSAEYPNIDDAVVRQVGELLGPTALIGGTGESIVGVGQEVEEGRAVSLWLSRMDDVNIMPMHLQLERTSEGMSIIGWPDQLAEAWPQDAVMLMVGDPFSFPADVMLERLNEDRPGTRVVGGMSSGGAAPGDCRLFFGQELHNSGAVAVILSGALRTKTVVSQGCRPVGHHLVVTKSEGNVIEQLGGKPALLQLKQVFDTLPTSDQKLIQRGLHLGRVVNEYQDQFEQGDFLVRNVMGIDPDNGTLAVGDFFRPGQTVQFHVRDHVTADDEMRQLLAAVRDDAEIAPRAALLFTCNGRGSRLFPEAHHDANLLKEYLGPVPLAGFFAAGELGPIGGRNFMHGFTASVVVFH